MTEFQKYIIKNHPDPDSLLMAGDKFEQMCRLATKFAEQQVKKLTMPDVKGSLNCWVKDTVENEKILVRESENGLKYLIFDDDSISYARIGNKIGEHETIHFNETNGKTILEAFTNDN